MQMIRLKPGLKTPTGDAWETSDDPAEHARWVKQGYNIGFLTGEPNNVTVVDIDDKGAAREFFAKHKDLLKTIVETKKGVHAFFRGNGPTRKIENGDLKRNGGYVVFPPSIVAGWKYKFVPGFEWSEELPEFPEELSPVPINKTSKIDTMISSKMSAEIRNVRRYIRGIKSIQGSGGSNACFRVACILRDAGFGETEALAEIISWNASGAAEPLWSVEELLHKVKSAFGRTLKQ